MKYRKKPVVVEAYKTDKEVVIHTLEGDMKASIGDYIITGVNGEQYPCKPDIFEKTYEVVNNTNYDRIRAKIANMTVDEMADYFNGIFDCSNCPNDMFLCESKGSVCTKYIKQWLESEVLE